MKRYLYWEIVVLLAVLLLINWAHYSKDEAEESQAGTVEQSQSHLAIPQLPGRVPNSIQEQILFVRGTDFSQLALKAAEDYLKQHRNEWKLREYHSAKGIVFVTPLGARVKYSVYQGDIPIQDMSIEFKVDRSLSIELVHNSYRPIARFNVKKDSILAFETIRERLSQNLEIAQNDYSTVLITPGGTDRPELAYVFTAKSRENSQTLNVIVRASDGLPFMKTVPRVEF